MNEIKIGFTERGDGGLDTSWYRACMNGVVNGVVVITKDITLDCHTKLVELHQQGFPVILHATVTGWGATTIEPRVPGFDLELTRIKNLLDDGFPLEHTVLRVDPIFPTPRGIRRACEVLDKALELGILPGARCRISILDEYAHVKERFRALGYQPIYGTGFHADPAQFQAVADALGKYDLTFYTCAEPLLTGRGQKNQFIQAGCLSTQDLKVMGLPVQASRVNPQHRNGCLCCGYKTELLTNCHPCAHGCAYCYWKD